MPVARFPMRNRRLRYPRLQNLSFFLFFSVEKSIWEKNSRGIIRLVYNTYRAWNTEDNNEEEMRNINSVKDPATVLRE